MRHVLYGFLCGAAICVTLLFALSMRVPAPTRATAEVQHIEQPTQPPPRPEPAEPGAPPADELRPALDMPANEGVAVSITGERVDAAPDELQTDEMTRLVEEVNRQAEAVQPDEPTLPPQPIETETLPPPAETETLPAPPPVPEPQIAAVEPDAAVPPAPEAPAASALPPAAGLEKQIGQMLIFGFQGTKPEQKWPATVARQLAEGTLGGVIFLRYNLANRSDGRRLMQAFRKAGAKADLPPLFVLDQEGGRVQRLAANVGVKQWPSASMIGKLPPSVARKHYDVMAAVVQDWGFNVNLGPVVDVNLNPANPVIGKLGRSYSRDPGRVVDYSRTFIDAHRRRGVLTALKHFPGHGSSRKDSHLGFTDISRTWNEEKELLPYRALIRDQHADMVMIGHLYLDKFHDGAPDKYPATFSPRIVTDLLRKELSFDGVVISDDMEMGAIRKHYGTFEAAIRAIKAGVDLLIVSNSAKPQRTLPEAYIRKIAEAARTDSVLRDRIAQSYGRIALLKKELRARPIPASQPLHHPDLPLRRPDRVDSGAVPTEAALRTARRRGAETWVIGPDTVDP